MFEGEKAVDKRKASDVLTEIEAKLATVDGIATADAFKLGGLVREYGDIKAGESVAGILTPLMDGLLKPKKDSATDKPWL